MNTKLKLEIDYMCFVLHGAKVARTFFKQSCFYVANVRNFVILNIIVDIHIWSSRTVTMCRCLHTLGTLESLDTETSDQKFIQLHPITEFDILTECEFVW